MLKGRLPHKIRHIAAFLTLLSAASVGGTSVQAQDDADGLHIQLNKMESVQDACRIYLVFENRTGRPFSSYKLDLVMFGNDGGIISRLAVEAGHLAKDKTLVKLFDVQGAECDGIGKVLLNNVMSCEAANGSEPISDCTGLSQTRSRLDTPFIK